MPWPWMIDELVYAGAEHLDPEFVAGYDRKQQFDPTDDVAILRGIGLGLDATLSILGAGTGTFALAAVGNRLGHRGFDVLAVMLDRLRRRADGLERPTSNACRPRLLEFESAVLTVDAVYTRNARTSFRTSGRGSDSPVSGRCSSREEVAAGART